MSDESLPQTFSTPDTGPLPDERAALTPEEQFAIDERRALRDMAAAATWFRREGIASAWTIPARVESESVESDVAERRLQTIATPRKEGPAADIDREDYANRGRLAAQQLRALEERERDMHRAKLAEFDAANTQRLTDLAELERVRDEIRKRCVAEMRMADEKALRARDGLTNAREEFAAYTSAAETLRVVSERLGSAAKRTAPEVIGEVVSTPRQRATWEATDGRKHGSTYWAGCGKAGRVLWVAAVRAWAAR